MTAIDTDKFEESIRESIMEQRLLAFYKRWAPEYKDEAAEFSMELHMLVRSIHAEAGEPAHKQLLSIVNSLPLMNVLREKHGQG